MSGEEQSSPEREQTDESLRVEREVADDALGDKPSSVDEIADAIIERARARADAILVAARREIDRLMVSQSPAAQPSEPVDAVRARDDKALRDERATADELLRAEREEQAAVLQHEREETDRDLARERARADQAVATRDEFLGIVSHDLRNMLGSVMGYTTLIENDALLEDRKEKVVDFAQRIRRAGNRMSHLIEDLVDLAGIHAGSLTVTREVGDPHAVVMEAVETFQAQAVASGVTLTTDLVPPPALVAFDAARILQVLVNFLSNAIKFTPSGGRAIVRVERIGEDVRFSVRDTGEGIPADKLESIFERFLQVTPNDRRGVGLGLYISKCIVQGHGGKIWAESTLGHGSNFCFTLPVYVPT